MAAKPEPAASSRMAVGDDAMEQAETSTSRRFADQAEAERFVATAWAAALRGRNAGLDQPYWELGLNTNRAIKIMQWIWQEIGVELPSNAFVEAPTIRQMAARFYDNTIGQVQDVVRMGGTGDKPVLFLHGSAGALHEWTDVARALPTTGAVYGLAASGTDGRAPMLGSFEAEGARMAALIRAVQPAGPYNIAGYSMGGCVSLETARVLRAGGHDVQLMLADTVFEEHYWPIPVWLRFIAPQFLAGVKRRLKQRRQAPRHFFDAEIFDVASRRRGTRYEFRFRNPRHPDYPYYSGHWQPYHLPLFSKIRLHGIRTKGLYRPSRYDGPVSFFVSRGGDPGFCNPRDVWPRYMPNVEWVSVPGNHISMLRGRYARHLAEEIASRLKLAP